jgi:hypothetical protein
MTNRGPFADWPNLDRPARPADEAPPPPEARAYLILPGSDQTEQNAMASNNALENFLGGSPLTVAIRLFFVSLVVGALLMWLELRPIDIFRGVQAFIDRISRLGVDAVKELASYVLAGAVIVVPAWFVLRLLNIGGRR